MPDGTNILFSKPADKNSACTKKGSDEGWCVNNVNGYQYTQMCGEVRM